MTYRVEILRRARRDLGELPVRVRDRAISAIRALSTQPRPPGSRKLRGRDGWRIRIGDYRVIYQVDDAQRLVTVVVVRHRREAYR